MYRWFYRCPDCNGDGERRYPHSPWLQWCWNCRGTGIDRGTTAGAWWK